MKRMRKTLLSFLHSLLAFISTWKISLSAFLRQKTNYMPSDAYCPMSNFLPWCMLQVSANYIRSSQLISSYFVDSTWPGSLPFTTSAAQRVLSLTGFSLSLSSSWPWFTATTRASSIDSGLPSFTSASSLSPCSDIYNLWATSWTKSVSTWASDSLKSSHWRPLKLNE